MRKGLRENPATATIDITWSPSKKSYVMTMSWHGGSGRHGVTRFRTLRHPLRAEIDAQGLELLGDAIEKAYSAWLF